MKERLATALEIEKCARSQGLTITELCRLAGIDRPRFWRWREGHRKITTDTYAALCEAAGSPLTRQIIQMNRHNP